MTDIGMAVAIIGAAITVGELWRLVCWMPAPRQGRETFARPERFARPILLARRQATPAVHARFGIVKATRHRGRCDIGPRYRFRNVTTRTEQPGAAAVAIRKRYRRRFKKHRPD